MTAAVCRRDVASKQGRNGTRERKEEGEKNNGDR